MHSDIKFNKQKEIIALKSITYKFQAYAVFIICHDIARLMQLFLVFF